MPIYFHLIEHRDSPIFVKAVNYIKTQYSRDHHRLRYITKRVELAQALNCIRPTVHLTTQIEHVTITVLKQIAYSSSFVI